MQSPFPGYWKNIDLLNKDSKSILSQNQHLQKRLEDLNKQLQYKDAELYNVETRLENLDIFEQHLTSLNLRCEFLDKQVSNLENKHRFTHHTTQQSFPSLSNNNTPLNGMREFKDRSCTNPNSIKIEWRTTETTLENLCTEFNYLKDQLNIANNHSGMDTSIVEDSSILSRSATDRSVSIFSDQEAPSMDDDYNTSNILKIKSISGPSSSSISNTSSKKSIQGKKKLLKMESFLNFADNMESQLENINTENDIVPLRGFNINTMNENPLCEKITDNKKIKIKGKQSIKNMKKKLEIVDLPSIIEEEIHPSCDNVNNNQDHDSDEIETEDDEYHELSIAYDSRFNRRHNSLPENSSLDGNNIIFSSDESIRHFTSYDTGLNSRFNHKNYDVTDFLFSKPAQMEDNQHISSSSPYSTFKASYIDDESYYEDRNLINYNQLNSKLQTSLLPDSDSDESYGDENATPLLLKKESQLSLYKCNSHESIFSTINNSKSINRFPLREKNLDLKAQTMKWLKPNMPLVSSSTQPFVQSLKVSVNSNAHNDILNILGVNKDSNSNITTPIKSSASSIRDTTLISQNNLTPNREYSSSPMLINKSNDSPIRNVINNSDGHLSSWFSSFIPNSAFTNPEIGKFIGQPSGKNINETNIKNKSNSYNCRYKTGENASVLTPVNFRKVRTNFNGPSSSLTIKKNGEKIITHGYGSGFNNKNVISSRVSHGALREALEQDMIF
ncbi:hypothetical protein C6P40_000610 [Pichia californica]|uniref:Uncharacterized protein n=1 Tax=Pichia californica TaxID=460514 RepID=A0A9P7BF92_9ASCO|nr:hypothetical protein C6P40_000610 [[Candida] californica]